MAPLQEVFFFCVSFIPTKWSHAFSHHFSPSDASFTSLSPREFPFAPFSASRPVKRLPGWAHIMDAEWQNPSVLFQASVGFDRPCSSLHRSTSSPTPFLHCSGILFSVILFFSIVSRVNQPGPLYPHRLRPQSFPPPGLILPPYLSLLLRSSKRSTLEPFSSSLRLLSVPSTSSLNVGMLSFPRPSRSRFVCKTTASCFFYVLDCKVSALFLRFVRSRLPPFPLLLVPRSSCQGFFIRVCIIPSMVGRT